MVTVTLSRVAASLLENAASVALRALRALGQPAPPGAAEASRALAHAITEADAPDPANIIVQARRPRR
jgi:hypothetical protein